MFLPSKRFVFFSLFAESETEDSKSAIDKALPDKPIKKAMAFVLKWA